MNVKDIEKYLLDKKKDNAIFQIINIIVVSNIFTITSKDMKSFQNSIAWWCFPLIFFISERSNENLQNHDWFEKIFRHTSWMIKTTIFDLQNKTKRVATTFCNYINEIRRDEMWRKSDVSYRSLISRGYAKIDERRDHVTSSYQRLRKMISQHID